MNVDHLDESGAPIRKFMRRVCGCNDDLSGSRAYLPVANREKDFTLSRHKRLGVGVFVKLWAFTLPCQGEDDCHARSVQMPLELALPNLGIIGPLNWFGVG